MSVLYEYTESYPNKQGEVTDTRELLSCGRSCQYTGFAKEDYQNRNEYGCLVLSYILLFIFFFFFFLVFPYPWVLLFSVMFLWSLLSLFLFVLVSFFWLLYLPLLLIRLSLFLYFLFLLCLPFLIIYHLYFFFGSISTNMSFYNFLYCFDQQDTGYIESCNQTFLASFYLARYYWR